MNRCESCDAPIDPSEWPVVTALEDDDGRRAAFFCDDACYARWRDDWECHVLAVPE